MNKNHKVCVNIQITLYRTFIRITEVLVKEAGDPPS